MFSSKRILITALAVTAAAAPSTASARFVLEDAASGPAPSFQKAQAAVPAPSSHQAQAAVPAPSSHQAQAAVPAPSSHQALAAPSTSGEFDWSDAGIGAAAAVVLMGGGTVAWGGRRRRGHVARA